MGLFQAAVAYSNPYLVINSMFDYEELGYGDATNRYHTKSVERYQTAEDLQEYFHGVFDILYTLDYLEAEVVISQLSNEQQYGYFNTIENYYITDVTTGEETNACNIIRKFTEEEWANLNLSSVYDLVDNNVLTYRGHALSAGQTSNTIGRNTYHYAQMFSPNYAALSNPKGAPGDYMFRQIAYELLAEKGYEDGFLAYTSDKYAEEAMSRGITGTQTYPYRYTVGHVTDDLVLEMVFGS